MTCIICESTIPDLHLVEIENHYVEVCSDCKRKIEETDGATGRWNVEACPNCGHVKYVRFKTYKKRGRPIGSKNDPIKRVERLNVKPLPLFEPKHDIPSSEADK